MSQTSQSRSVRATNEGIKKLNDRRLEKGLEESKKGWSQEELARRAFVEVSTVKRFLKGVPVDRDSVLTITNALSLQPEEVVDPKEWNPAEQTFDPIDWREVCSKVLAQQRETLRRSITGRHLGHEAKNVYVKLGLVKPKEQPSRGNEFQPSAERGMLQYQLTEKEIEQEYQYDEFLEQVIEGKEKNLTIVGEPGAGKSTWLEQIALYVDNSKKGFPICIPLASLGGKTLEEYLFQTWLKKALLISQCDVSITSAQKKLEELFKSGKVWLLLDGVDEMRVDESPLQAIATQLEGWGDLARVVLTCRSNVWEANPNALLNFETYRTLHFDDEQVGDFIQQWFTQEGKPKLGEELETKLDEARNDRIRDLIKNPLRLAMLCGIWYFHQGDLPKTKATLYQQYIEYFYRWKTHPQLTDDLDKQEELHAAFSKLALEAIDKNLPLRKKFAHKVMGKSLFQLARDVGWLNWVYKDAETGEDVYAFFHLTFQEYFAACAIGHWHFFLKHIPDNPMQGTYRIFESQWKEVFLLWLGRENLAKEQKEALIKTLVDFEDGWESFYPDRAHFLAASGIAEFRECSQNDVIVGVLVAFGFGYFNKEQQERVSWLYPIAEAAREVLKETDHEKAIAFLIAQLETPVNDYIRSLVAESLGKIGKGNQAAIKTLLRLVHPNQTEFTRRQAAFSLGQIQPRNKTAIATLVELIQTTQYEVIRRDVAEKLGQIDPGNKIAITTLVKLIETTQDEENCRLAVFSLGKIGKGNQAAIDTLVRLIQTIQAPETCRKAVLSLEKIGTGNEKVIALLVRLIQSTQNEFIRWQLADILGQIDSAKERAIAFLVELLQTTQDENIYQKAASSLGEIDSKNQKAIAALIQLIRTSQDEDIRWKAASSLGTIDPKNKTALTAIVQLLQSCGDETKLWEKALMLGQVDPANETAVAALVKLIQTAHDEYTCRLAALSLREILQGNQFTKVVKDLRSCLTHQLYENNFRLYEYCYEIIWHCAQNMPYTDFYQAWHQPSVEK